MSIELEKEVDRLNSKIMMLTRDLDRKHRECAERERQCMMLAEDNERLQDELKHIKATIERFLNGHAVGERGSCGNL